MQRAILTLLTLTGSGLSLLLSPFSYATNGMSLEGYGSKSTAMGGTSMAFEVGNAAMMTNPATLALLPAGNNHINIALRDLRPDVSSHFYHPEHGKISAESSGTSYLMPSLSYVRRQGAFSFGAGVFAQGGMGTDYSADAFLALGTGDEVRSEVSVGRVIFPLAWRVNDKLSLGASLALVWAGTDLKIAAAASDLQGMMQGGTLQPQFNQAIDGGMVQAARIDFSNGSDYSGAASGYGWAGKLGFTYQLTPQLSIGGAYHLETRLDDLDTDEAQLAGYATQADGSLQQLDMMTLQGIITIKDFQWPSAWAIGAAYEPHPQFTLAVDFKRINWSEVLETYEMNFTAAPEYGGGSLDIVMPQGWSDQNVLHVGLEYRVTPQLALRTGANLANNPVPAQYLNPLFPAIARNHVSVGAGYVFNQRHQFAFSLVRAFPHRVTRPDGIQSEVDQLNWTVDYVYRW